MSAIRLTGMASGLDTESIVKQLMQAQETKKQKLVNKKTTLEWQQDKWKELNTKIYALYTGELSTMKTQGSFQTKKTESSDESKVSVTANNKAISGTQTVEVTSLASAQYVTGNKIAGSGITSSTTLESLGITSGTVITIGGTSSQSLTIDSSKTIADFVDTCKSAGLNASFDATQKRLFISSKTSGAAQAFSIDAGADNALLSKIGLNAIDSASLAAQTDPSFTTAAGMTVVKASDAVINLNGATLTSSTNTITANNLTITAKAKTTSAVTINTTNDVDAIYNSVKKFVKSYNSILKEMNDLYYAKDNKYEPLSDDEKEAMTDDQVEKWETKAKEKILRRDSKMGSLLNVMKSELSGVYEDTATGKKYSLGTFGIMTSTDYTEKGLLHIYGDQDDPVYAAKKDKLKTALEENPDAVMNTLTKVAGDLYKEMTDMTKTSSVNSALTFYNDKVITKNLREYQIDISEFEDKLDKMENSYYKKFSAMETAMSKMQSQTNSLANMLGTNQ